MLRTTKKELVFFEDFINMIDTVYEASEKFETMLADYKNVQQHIQGISDLEHKCDAIVHKTFERVNLAFITPIDREDILIIIKTIDDIIDQIEETAYRFSVYNVKAVKPEAVQFAKLIKKAVVNLQKLIRLIPQKSNKDIHELIVIVNRIENEGDALYRKEIANLFTNETNAIEIIRWNGIYDCFENTLDACEHVANLVEGIVMKNA